MFFRNLKTFLRKLGAGLRRLIAIISPRLQKKPMLEEHAKNFSMLKQLYGWATLQNAKKKSNAFTIRAPS
jgi:hypothetical protein